MQFIFRRFNLSDYYHSVNTVAPGAKPSAGSQSAGNSSRQNRKVPKRIANTVIQSLKGGVVPRIGLPYITVGRKNEIDVLLNDVDVIADGGASFRFIVGKYGSGKVFFCRQSAAT